MTKLIYLPMVQRKSQSSKWCRLELKIQETTPHTTARNTRRLLPKPHEKPRDKAIIILSSFQCNCMFAYKVKSFLCLSELGGKTW